MASCYWHFLQQCLASGYLNGASLGMTREQVQAVLGEPDDTGGTSRKQRLPLVWKYDDVELHFTTSGILVRFFWQDAQNNSISIDEDGHTFRFARLQSENRNSCDAIQEYAKVLLQHLDAE